MGGQPSLGYDVKDRKLVVNEAEAETVRHVFRRYRDLKSVRLLAVELEAEGVLSKVRRAANGGAYVEAARAGSPLCHALEQDLSRRDRPQGQRAPGEHAAIIDEALWSEVQEILASNRVDRDTGLKQAGVDVATLAEAAAAVLRRWPQPEA